MANKIKIIYLANARIPTEKAHGIQIIKTCESFASAGNELELVVPLRFNPIKENPFEYYGVKRIFKITRIFSFDLVKLGKIGFWIQSFSFAKLALIYTLIKNPDIIYSREILPLFFLSFFKKNIFWEAHRGEFNFIVRRLLKKCRGIITITQGLKDFYLKNGADREKILVASDGVDLKKFDIKISKKEAREKLEELKKLNLFQGQKIVLYVGHLYDWKGAGNLLSLSIVQDFKDKDVLFVFVGGTKEDIETFRTKGQSPKRCVTIVGYRPPQEIPYWLKAADILVLPNSAKEKISEFYTSPLKLFEYMASGRPIVASDLPSIREILNEKNAVLVKPDIPVYLAEGIKKILENPDFSDKISKQAYLDVRNYTWEKRAGKILKFIKK